MRLAILRATGRIGGHLRGKVVPTDRPARAAEASPNTVPGTGMVRETLMGATQSLDHVMCYMVVVRAVVDVGGTEVRLRERSGGRRRGGGQRATPGWLSVRGSRGGDRDPERWSSSREKELP
jgi:hypothetical protein